MRQFFSNLTKYVVEGLVVAIVAFYITQRQRDLKTVAMIGLIAALTFALLDYFSPSIGASSRLGAGFGIGSNLVGFGHPSFQGAGQGSSIAPQTTIPSVESFVNTAESYPQYIAVESLQPATGTDVFGNQLVVQVPTNTSGTATADALESKYFANPVNGYAIGTPTEMTTGFVAEGAQ